MMDEHAGHDHGHADHAGHAHGLPSKLGRAFAIGMTLNLAFVVLGVIVGIAANSTALLADAAHNLGDALGLALAWGATVLARRARTQRRTYGLRRTTIVATVFNAMLILVAIGGVSWEAIRRLGHPHEVSGGLVAIVAAVGVGINGIAALLFAKGRAGDMNARAAFLHLVADAAVSAGVVVSGLVVWRTGWWWVDPASSLVVSLVIVRGTWKLFREAMDLLLDAVPAHIDLPAVEAYLRALPDVVDLHDLHVWSMSTTEVALTAHVLVRWNACSPTFLRDAQHHLEHRFKIGHATIQLEPIDQGNPCAQGVGNVV